jgi:hypothetical protein
LPTWSSPKEASFGLARTMTETFRAIQSLKVEFP